MNDFSEKAINTELIQMGVVKLIFENKNNDPQDISLHIVIDNGGDIYVQTIGYTCLYEEIEPKNLLNDVKKEVEESKKRAQDFEYREILYKKDKSYYISGIISYIKWELYGLCDISNVRFSYSDWQVIQLESEIEIKLQNNRSPMQIFNELKNRYKVNLKTNQIGYELSGKVEKKGLKDG